MIIFTNAESLLTVTVPERGSKKAIPEFQVRAADFLRRLDFPQDQGEDGIKAMQEVVVARTASRSTLGSMNEIGHYIKAMVEPLSSADNINWYYVEDMLADSYT